MFKYILPLFFILSIASCSNNTTVQKPMDPSGTASVMVQTSTVSTISAAMPVQTVQSTATGFDMKALETLQKQQQQKYNAFAQTKLADCDSSDVTKTSEEILRSQGTRPDRVNVIVSSAPERCKIRAIIRDSLGCSVLAESGSIERCEYAKKATKEIEDFREKQAVYERLF